VERGALGASLGEGVAQYRTLFSIAAGARWASAIPRARTVPPVDTEEFHKKFASSLYASKVAVEGAVHGGWGRQAHRLK